MILYRAVHIVNGWKIPPDNSGHPNYLFWVPLFLRVILLGVHDIANHFFPRGTLHTWALWFLGWSKCMFVRILGKKKFFRQTFAHKLHSVPKYIYGIITGDIHYQKMQRTTSNHVNCTNFARSSSFTSTTTRTTMAVLRKWVQKWQHLLFFSFFAHIVVLLFTGFS